MPLAISVRGRPRSRWVAVLARVVVTAALLAVVFQQVAPEQVVRHLGALSPAFIALAAAYYAVCQLLSAYRWQLFLTAKGFSVPVSRLFAYYLIGMFGSMFLPTAVGGDAARGYYLYRRIEDGNIAVSSVFLERFAGLVGLTILAICALAVGLDRGLQPLVLVTVGSSVAVLGAVVLLLWWETLFTRLQAVLGSLLPARLAQRIQALYAALWSYRRHRTTLVRAVLLSVVIQALYALYFGVVAWGLGIEIDVYYFVLFQPVVTLAMLAPVSVGGLGVREAALVVLFREVGTTPADIVAVSLTAYLLCTPLRLCGGALLVWQRRSKVAPARA